MGLNCRLRRFDISPLKAAGTEQRRVLFEGEQKDFFLFSASVHYEVAAEDMIQPYKDSCPLCGITGKYDMPITSISNLSSTLNCRIDEQFYEEGEPLRLGIVFFLA